MFRGIAIALAITLAASAASNDSSANDFDLAAINSAGTTDFVGPDSAGSAALRAQILLARAHFSPAEIDGKYGTNLRAALYGFQASRKLPLTGVVDAAT